MADELTHEAIDDWRKRESPHPEDLATFREYAASEQKRTLSHDQKTILGETATHGVADNILRLVIATAAARLELEGFTVDNPEVQEFLDELYLHTRWGKLQFDTTFAALRDGNTGVSLRWKPSARDDLQGRVTLHRELWWDGQTGLFIAYDDYDEPAFAVREFVEITSELKKRRRRVVYYPDLICRFVREGEGWKPHRIAGDPLNEPDGRIPWVKKDGTPLGLPVVAFSNSSGDDGLYGQSEFVGLLGLQDAINSIQHDITAAAMFAGFQMYTATGFDASDKKNLVGPGRMIYSDNKDSRFGTLPPGPMDSLTDAHKQKRETISIDTATPMHIIAGGQWPSGEALLRSEMPLVDKVRRLAKVIGPSWVMVAHRSTEIANTFGSYNLDEDAPITAKFLPPERLDEMTTIQVQQARADLYASLSKISDEVLLKKLGLLTDDEIAALMAEREKRAKELLTTVGEFGEHDDEDAA